MTVRIVGLSLLALCMAPHGATASPEMALSDYQAREDAKRRAPAIAAPRTVIAEGLKSCRITNNTDFAVVGLKPAKLPLRWHMTAGREHYPGSNIYFLIDGKRYSTPQNKGYVLDAAIMGALFRDLPAAVSWTGWPYGETKQSVVTLTGFTAAFEECRAFLAKPL